MTLTSTTLSDFASDDASPSSEERHLRTLIEGPNGSPEDWDTFMMNLYDGCSPTREVRSVENPDILTQLRRTVEQHADVDYHSEAPHSKRAYKAKKGLLDAIDAQLEAIEFPHPAEWPVDESLIEFISHIDIPQPWDPDFHRQSWEYVWNECNAEDIRFIRDALRVAYGTSGRRPAVDGVLNGFRYYADDATVEDIFTIPRRGKGAPRHVVIDNIDDVMQRLDPVVGAMLSHWVTEVKTNKGRKKRGGYYNYASRYVNVKSDSPTEDSRYGTTTAHELGHALHHLYQFRPASGRTVDNRDTDPSEWVWDVPAPDHDETSSSQDTLHACVRMEWDKLRSGETEPLRGYQTANAAEFFADAFACWVCSPEVLGEIQPGMKRVFDGHFAPRDRHTAPLREQLFDYWDLTPSQTNGSNYCLS